jgi:hypothetical protein
MPKPFGSLKRGIVAFAAAGLAAAAYGSLGSVISSFPASFSAAHSVYRDADYVYVVTIPYHGINVGFSKYTPNGSLAGSNSSYPEVQRVAEDADASFLGPGYMTIALEVGISTYDMSGFLVREDHMNLMESVGYAYRSGGPYYYVETWSTKDATYANYRFNTAGSLLGSFAPTYPGPLAATDRFAGLSGEYLIAANGSTSIAYTPLGSIVATFGFNAGSTYGCGIGPGYPTSYGPTLWVGHYAGSGSGWVYQIDLGNGTAIQPASLGKVKILFR